MNHSRCTWIAYTGTKGATKENVALSTRDKSIPGTLHLTSAGQTKTKRKKTERRRIRRRTGAGGERKRRRWEWGGEEIRQLKVLRQESEEARSSPEWQGGGGVGRERWRGVNRNPLWHPVSLLPPLLPPALNTQTHSHIVTFPEDPADQFLVLILMEAWAAAEKDSLQTRWT